LLFGVSKLNRKIMHKMCNSRYIFIVVNGLKVYKQALLNIALMCTLVV